MTDKANIVFCDEIVGRRDDNVGEFVLRCPAVAVAGGKCAVHRPGMRATIQKRPRVRDEGGADSDLLADVPALGVR